MYNDYCHIGHAFIIGWMGMQKIDRRHRLSQFFKLLLGRTRSRAQYSAAIQLSHHPEPSGRAVHGEVDGLDIRGQNGRRFVFLRQTHRPPRGRTPFVQTRAEMSDTGTQAVKANPKCSRNSHSNCFHINIKDFLQFRRQGFWCQTTMPQETVSTLQVWMYFALLSMIHCKNTKMPQEYNKQIKFTVIKTDVFCISWHDVSLF